MGILFFDTETTGKLINHLPADDPRQPRIVQLAAILCAGDGAIRNKISVLVKPDQWTVPDEAARIHGFTTKMCEESGIPLRMALDLLAEVSGRADTVVAHNIEYDLAVVRGEHQRLAIPVGGVLARKSFCTMKAATPVLNLPGRYGPKWPTLRETYRHFFNTDFDDAHDALGDVVACMKCYFKLIAPDRDQMTWADDGGR